MGRILETLTAISKKLERWRDEEFKHLAQARDVSLLETAVRELTATVMADTQLLRDEMAKLARTSDLQILVADIAMSIHKLKGGDETRLPPLSENIVRGLSGAAYGKAPRVPDLPPSLAEAANWRPPGFKTPDPGDYPPNPPFLVPPMPNNASRVRELELRVNALETSMVALKDDLATANQRLHALENPL